MPEWVDLVMTLGGNTEEEGMKNQKAFRRGTQIETHRKCTRRMRRREERAELGMRRYTHAAEGPKVDYNPKYEATLA